MKFNKSLWHYKFNSKMTSSFKTLSMKGVCDYFWFTMWNIVKALAVLLVLVIGLAVISWVTLVVIVFLLGILTHTFILGELFMCSVVGIGFGSLVVLIFTFLQYLDGSVKLAPDYMTQHFKKSIKVIDKELKAKPPSLFKEYYKAFKASVCPMIEWE